MKQGKRMRNAWEWCSPQEKESKFGGGKPDFISVENRKPIYFIDSSETENEVYFVNNSDKPIITVLSSFTSEWPKTDDDKRFFYENVLPGEAVKIDDFDPIYDYKELIQQDVWIENNEGIRNRFFCNSYGNIIPQTVLLWDNGDCGKGVNME